MNTPALSFVYAEALFGWARRGGMCMECHITDKIEKQLLQQSPQKLCHLPPLPLLHSVKEGSTGIDRVDLEVTSL